jgi:hypothetical protein
LRQLLQSCFILPASRGCLFDRMKPEFSAARSTALRESSGSEIAEAAVVLPILFMLLIAIFWFGRAFSIYGTINHAGREGVRTASVPACANCDAPCTWQGSLLPCDAMVVTAVDNALIAAHLDPAQLLPSPPNPLPQACPAAVPAGTCATVAGGGFTICRNVVLNLGGSSPPVCGAIISFQYPYQLALPFTSLNNQRVLLRTQVEMRGED